MTHDSEPPAITYDECYTDLRSCREQFESIRRDVEDLVSAISPGQLVWRPRGGEWSIKQCIAYLNTIASSSVERLHEIEAVLEEVPHHSKGPWHSGVNGPVLKAQSNNNGTSTNSPVPDPEVDEELDVVGEFRTLNDRIMATIELGERIAAAMSDTANGDRSESLLAELGHTLQLTAMQHWRYILQARRITERPNFPHQ